MTLPLHYHLANPYTTPTLPPHYHYTTAKPPYGANNNYTETGVGAQVLRGLKVFIGICVWMTVFSFVESGMLNYQLALTNTETRFY